jgi:hypothetical protein
MNSSTSIADALNPALGLVATTSILPSHSSIRGAVSAWGPRVYLCGCCGVCGRAWRSATHNDGPSHVDANYQWMFSYLPWWDSLPHSGLTVLLYLEIPVMFTEDVLQ